MAENETFEESLNRFLTTITAELESLKKITALYAPVLAPGFNVVDCLYPDENRLSSVIAMLLDPKGGHGQGATFLEIFLELITPNDLLDETYNLRERLIKLRKVINQKENVLQSKCKLEVTTNYLDDENKKRRIDILLDLNKFGLAIENKPWAKDQPRQILDYHSHLSHENNYGSDFILIYVSANGTPPCNESIELKKRLAMEVSGHFLVLSYTQLKEWCQLCTQKCQAPRLRYFLEDFTSYIRDKFEGGIPIMEVEVVIENALKSGNIGAAVAVGFAWPEIANRLFTQLVKLVIKESGINDEWKHEIDFDLLEANSSFWIQAPNWKKYRYKFNFDYANARGFFSGIAKQSEKVEDIPNNLVNKFKDAGLVVDGQSKWWPCYQYFDDHYRDWSMSEKPWVGIKEGGDTVKEIAKRLKLLIDICTSDIDKLEAELNSVSS